MCPALLSRVFNYVRVNQPVSLTECLKEQCGGIFSDAEILAALKELRSRRAIFCSGSDRYVAIVDRIEEEDKPRRYHD